MLIQPGLLESVLIGGPISFYTIMRHQTTGLIAAKGIHCGFQPIPRCPLFSSSK